jgi:sugar/nucleoside kinase (ribokinase family)
VWGIEGTDKNGDPIIPNIKRAMELTLNEGVREKVIVHCKKMAFSLDKSGEFTECYALSIPRSMILGSVGAGDSFCAGSLYSLYRGLSDKDLLEFASAAAGCNLFAENSTDGMLPKEEILKILEKYPPMP